MTWSLRSRVMLAAGIVLALALGGSGLVLFGLVRSSLIRSFDETLATQARTLSGLVHLAGPADDLVLRAAPGVDLDRDILPESYEIVAKGHKGIRHTPSLSDAYLPHPEGGTVATPRIQAQQLPNGQPGRIAFVTVTIPRPQSPAAEPHHAERPADPEQRNPGGSGRSDPKEEKHDDEHEYEFEGLDANGRKVHIHTKGRPERKPEASVITTPSTANASAPAVPTTPVTVGITVAQETAKLDRQLALIGGLLLAVTAIALVVSEGIMAYAIRRSLRPIVQLAEGISRLNDDARGQRVELPDVPVELTPVVARLNDLLARIETVLMRERGFNADVSHELRTPLAGLLSTIDVCLRKSRDPETYQRTLTTCRRITGQMQGVVRNLLDLTQLESGNVTAVRAPIDVVPLIRAQWQPFAERATMRRISVQWRLGQGLALTDPERLGQLLSNLFDNAVSYVNEGGSIAIACHTQHERLVISIANTGSTITAEQCAHVFERFWRADRARVDSHAHCGLGLALCQRLARVLDGTIAARSQPGGWFHMELTLPTADQGHGAVIAVPGDGIGAHAQVGVDPGPALSESPDR